MRRAAVARSPFPSSSRRSERKYTWKRRSPSSSTSFSSSPASAASATSYASSTVCGTIVRAVCSRSHGQSRRSRSVRRWSSTRACTGPFSLLAGRRRCGGRGGGQRRVARLVRDVLVERLLHVVEPVRHRRGLLRLQELLANRLLHVLQGRRLLGLHCGERLDDVPAVG